MQEYRTQAGGPSLRDLEKLTRALGHPYSRTTIAAKLKGESRADWTFVETFVRACARHSGTTVTAADLGSWQAAHRSLLTELAALRTERRDRLRGSAAASAELASVPPEAEFARARAEYLERLRQRYRRVDLEVLTPLTEQGNHPEMLLGKVFVPQTARADPPPVELPRELWRRLAEAGEIRDQDLPEGLDKNLLDKMRASYQDRPAKPVLDVIAGPDGQHLVLLGDPGAGKSTLARYLMLALAETAASRNTATPQTGDPALSGIAEWLPLLVELRTYADPRWRDGTFLDLIDHLHTTEHLGLPRPLLDDFLRQNGRAVMVFDGLDEVFDPAIREQIARQIEAFAARYPQVRVIVTSRVIGYRRAIFDAAGFTHWMLQDLTLEQITTFTTAWYRASCAGNPAEAERLRERLLGAVRNSPAVAELAGNPMLLTILAIIGRRQELPRERLAVYQHAVSVLVEHWDTTGKHLHYTRAGGMPYLAHQDKLELLRLVARRMQDAPAGFSGNHVPGPDLITEFDTYLRERFELPASRALPAARAMLDQLRERNFILAQFGAEVYGFVHRAFLEYLAAADICQRFSSREMTESELLHVFRDHWEDPAWQEVLVLIAGMIPPRFTGQAINGLLTIGPVRYQEPEMAAQPVLLALRCLGEVRKPGALAAQSRTTAIALTSLIDTLIDTASDMTPFGAVSRLPGALEGILPVLAGLGPDWAGRREYENWYLTKGQFLSNHPLIYELDMAAARIYITHLAQNRQDAHHLSFLAKAGSSSAIRRAAVEALAAGWGDDPATMPWLRERATTDQDGDVRRAAVQALAAGWGDEPATAGLLRERATTDQHAAVRQAAVETLATD